VKSLFLIPCEGQKSIPLATTLIGTEIARTGRQRSGEGVGGQFSERTHTEELVLRSTVPDEQKQPAYKEHYGGLMDIFVSFPGFAPQTDKFNLSLPIRLPPPPK